MGKRMIKSRAMLLAGVSALAMLACVAEADAETFLFTGGVQSFTVPTTGEYALDVLGASGGNGAGGGGGDLGAEVSGDIFLTAGETLTLFVGGQGQKGTRRRRRRRRRRRLRLSRNQCPCCRWRRGRGGLYDRRWSRTGRDRRRSGGRRPRRGGRRERERRRRGDFLSRR